MNLSNRHIAISIAGLVIGTAAMIYLVTNTDPFSNINESDTSGVSQSGNAASNTENSATVTDSGEGSVLPNDLEAEHSGIINLGG